MELSFEGNTETLGQKKPLVGEKKNTFLGVIPPNLTPEAEGNLVGGEFAGASLTSGSFDTLLGWGAGHTLTTQKYSVALGYEALYSSEPASAPDNNIAIGFRALRAVKLGGSNVAIGEESLLSLVGTREESSNNVSLGYESARAATQASNNVISGWRAAASAEQLNENLIMGFEAKSEHVGSVSSSTILGSRAGKSVSPISTVTMLGYEAGAESEGEENLFLGIQAGLGVKENCKLYARVGKTNVIIAEGKNNSLGTVPKIGFLGAAPVVRQKIGAELVAATATAKECAERINSIHTALVNLGLGEV